MDSGRRERDSPWSSTNSRLATGNFQASGRGLPQANPFECRLRPDAKTHLSVGIHIWRRERDSNPRCSCPQTAFPRRRHRPLGDPTVACMRFDSLTRLGVLARQIILASFELSSRLFSKFHSVTHSSWTEFWNSFKYSGSLEKMREIPAITAIVNNTMQNVR